jgi:hypothetical protein
MVDSAALGQVSSKYFGFPCHPFIPLTVPQSPKSTIQGWYYRPINGSSNSGFGSTPVIMLVKINRNFVATNCLHFEDRKKIS